MLQITPHLQRDRVLHNPLLRLDRVLHNPLLQLVSMLHITLFLWLDRVLHISPLPQPNQQLYLVIFLMAMDRFLIAYYYCVYISV